MGYIRFNVNVCWAKLGDSRRLSVWYNSHMKVIPGTVVGDKLEVPEGASAEGIASGAFLNPM